MTDAVKPASDLPTRFAAGVVMIGVALTATWLGGWWFRLLGAAAAAVMIVEWADMHRVKRLWAYAAAGLIAAALLGLAEYLYPVGEELLEFDASDLADNWLGFAALAVLALVVGAASRRVTMGWGFVYIALPSFALLSLSWIWETLVFWVFAVTWATDTFAYFAGRAIGGPKLAPGISPNKTWAGLIGGMAGAGLAGWLLATWFEMEPFFLWMGAPMGLVAQLGDLYESWEKRRAGVKDSGSLLPGHGGVLDRLDGLLAVAIATTLLLMAGLWTA
ncbi:MAG: phosphatidate cytidylyltransferase [Sphingomonadales bacterium]|jgi:phosphatidate cytidylyltransferase|nr:phosphatidate cytidylyltransferase [Sphingomonadales bacterium]